MWKFKAEDLRIYYKEIVNLNYKLSEKFNIAQKSLIYVLEE